MQVVCPGCRDPKNEVVKGSAHFPFCSSHCQGRDLAGWVFEEYKVDGGPPEPAVDDWDPEG